MTRPVRKSVGDTRNQLPALLADAEKGRATIVTRHGRSIAAIVPVADVERGGRQRALTALAGSGKGLWGRDSTRALRRARDEWSR